MTRRRSLVLCRECGEYFVPGVNGEGNVCDECLGIERDEHGRPLYQRNQSKMQRDENDRKQYGFVIR